MTYTYKFVKAKLDSYTGAPNPCDLSVLGQQGWYLAHIMPTEAGWFYILVLPKE